MVTVTDAVAGRTKRRMEWERIHESEMSPETISVTLDKHEDFVSTASSGDGLSWYSDSYREAGEQAKGASPLAYLLSSVGFCQFVHYVEHCSLDGIKLDAMRMNVNGQITFQRPRRFTTVTYEVHITSSEHDDTVRKLARSAAEDCFVTNTLKRSCRVVGVVIHNGTKIDEHT
jgi:uncharacterized OsmC-like protein